MKQEKLNISFQNEEKNVQYARDELARHSFYSATSFASYAPGHIDELAKDISNYIYRYLTPAEAKDFQFTKIENLTFNELIQKCQENSDNPMNLRKYCVEIAKISPVSAVRVILSFPQAWPFLPLFCKTEETFNFLLNEIKNLFISQRGYKYFSDLFLSYGFVEKSMKIYNSIDVAVQSTEKEFRSFCWNLFLLFEN